jgi:branched-subunit amino acid transport protein
MNYLILFIITGAITFAFRGSMFGNWLTVPPLLKRSLRYVPYAVLTAIFVPELVFSPTTNALDISLGNVRLLAGVAAVLIAFVTKSVLITCIIGMILLWLLLGLHGGS